MPGGSAAANASTARAGSAHHASGTSNNARAPLNRSANVRRGSPRSMIPGTRVAHAINCRPKPAPNAPSDPSVTSSQSRAAMPSPRVSPACAGWPRCSAGNSTNRTARPRPWADASHARAHAALATNPPAGSSTMADVPAIAIPPAIAAVAMAVACTTGAGTVENRSTMESLATDGILAEGSCAGGRVADIRHARHRAGAPAAARTAHRRERSSA